MDLWAVFLMAGVVIGSTIGGYLASRDWITHMTLTAIGFVTVRPEGQADFWLMAGDSLVIEYGSNTVRIDVPALDRFPRWVKPWRSPGLIELSDRWFGARYTAQKEVG